MIDSRTLFRSMLQITIFCCLLGLGADAQSNAVLATPRCEDPGPWRTAMDRKNIYWTDFAAGKVFKAPVAGGEITTLASGQKGACGIATDGFTVYWTNSVAGAIMKVSVEGGSPVFLASGQDHPSMIGLTRGELFYATGINTIKKITIAPTDSKFAYAMSIGDDGKRSGPTVHCDLCPDYCSRTVCDTKGCHDEKYICGWHSCNCTQR